MEKTLQVLVLLTISAYCAATDAATPPLPARTDEKGGAGAGAGASSADKRSDDTGLRSLEVLVQQQATALQALKAQVTSLENTLQARISALESKQPASFQPVAFTVQFSYDDGNHGNVLSPHSILTFDQVLTNEGDGYHPNTGLFTAPLSGLYVFFLRMMSPDQHGHVRLAIDREGQQVLGEVWAQGLDDPTDQGSTLVSVHLSEGEKVWVRQDGGDAVRGSFWTVFSGFLVQAD